MPKKLNTTEKKLQFHCSACFTVYQLLEVQKSYPTNSDKCLNNCLTKWKALLVDYCQEQIILDLTRQEQAKEEKTQAITDWLNKIRKENHE